MISGADTLICYDASYSSVDSYVDGTGTASIMYDPNGTVVYSFYSARANGYAAVEGLFEEATILVASEEIPGV